MIRHLIISAWLVIALAALRCGGQDEKIPFLQIERDQSPSLQQAWSESANAADLAVPDTALDASFEPAIKRNNAIVPSPRQQRVIDGNFLLANGSSVAMTFLDYATSRHCEALHECTEANPMMPTSLSGMILVGVVSDAAISGYSYWLKRRHFRVVWFAVPTANAALHLWGMSAGLKSW